MFTDRQAILRNTERQPQHFGANAGTYMNGQSVGTGDNPPTWSPEMATDPTFPYGVEEWPESL